MPNSMTFIGWLSTVLIGLAGSLTFGSLCFHPQKFDYIAKEPALLNYPRDLIRVEQETANQTQEDPFSALVTLKTEIARQYAQAADHNRQINKRRERHRSIAGLAALGSVLMTVFLVGVAYAAYLSTKVEKEANHVGRRATGTQSATGATGDNPPGQPGQLQGASPAPDADSH